MTHLHSLVRFTAPPLSKRFTRVIAFASLPVLAIAAALGYGFFRFFSSENFGISQEHIGGDPLEMAFWITAIGATFLSFYMMELLFRSSDVRLLAQLPIPSLDILALRFRKICALIFLPCFPLAAFLFPVWTENVGLAALCVAEWFVGSLMCCVVSTAVLMYAGTASLAKNANAAFSAQLFSAAPAVGLGIALVADLLLKLLAEAFLRPNYLNAALTASSILLGITAVSAIYAVLTFKKRYSAILSNFMDNDMVMLNAGYQFIDDKTRCALQKATSPEDALLIKDVAQASRKHTLSRVLIITLSIILGLVSFYSPDTVRSINLSLLCVAIVFLLAPTWLWLAEDSFTHRLPVAPEILKRTRLRAAFSLTHVNAIVLTLAAALPTLSSHTVLGVVFLLLTPALIYGLTFVFSCITNVYPAQARLITRIFAALAGICCFIW